MYIDCRCTIRFDHPNGIYNSGNTLNGYVILQTGKLKLIRGISIKVIGYGKSFWCVSKNKNSTSFKSHEQYLNSVTYVVGSAEGNSFDFVPGIYEYTFTCVLPQELPTSITEEYCKIKYNVIVTIEQRLRFDNVFKKEFVVNHISDLNLMSINNISRKNMSLMEMNPIFRLCCYDDGDGDVKAELEVSSDGFVPGQLIPFKLIVYNDSNENLSGAEVRLLKCYTVESTEPYKKEKEFQKELLIKFFGNIPRHTNRELEDTFYVPHIPPSHGTRFIRLDYKVTAKIPCGYMKKLNVEVPVTIGTIPLIDFDPNKPITACPKHINQDADSVNSINSNVGILPDSKCEINYYVR